MFWFINVLPLVSEIGSPSFRRFIVNLLPWKDLHQMRDMVDYMYDIATGIYENKKHAFEKGDEAVTQQIGRGKDLISILSKRAQSLKLIMINVAFSEGESESQ